MGFTKWCTENIAWQTQNECILSLLIARSNITSALFTIYVALYSLMRKLNLTNSFKINAFTYAILFNIIQCLRWFTFTKYSLQKNGSVLLNVCFDARHWLVYIGISARCRCIYAPYALSLCYDLVSLLEGPVSAALGHFCLLHSLLELLRNGLALLPQNLQLLTDTLHVQRRAVLLLQETSVIIKDP